MRGTWAVSRRALLGGAGAWLGRGLAARAQTSAPLVVFAYGRRFGDREQAALAAWGGVLARLADGWFDRSPPKSGSN